MVLRMAGSATPTLMERARTCASQHRQTIVGIPHHTPFHEELVCRGNFVVGAAHTFEQLPAFCCPLATGEDPALVRKPNHRVGPGELRQMPVLQRDEQLHERTPSLVQ